ncbi:MAG TPA: biotin carboxylase N-terminal domain-containing protein [Anaerovoracaceae bacterium]|nr:biotin carboxylase N-terminal domain-containing protein [Anaerovoracaceae bacterium]
MMKRLLIANRGEIVSRIMRTCDRLGIETVVVYSEADRDAPYIEKAATAYCIGPSNPARSYLDIDALVGAVKDSQADAVHPGYGFLSETAAFAEAVTAAGMKWIGPAPEILAGIESKCYCRQLAQELGIPVTPGTLKPVTDVGEILDTAHAVGVPILLKLDKGGGGKGIEFLEDVTDRQAVTAVYERMRRIGEMAFASGDVYVEKAVPAPRHIEVQFLADDFGNVVCLGERECSIQRRYQKLIEESPSSVIFEKEREALYGYTVKLIREMRYSGAGTIEYLRDRNGNFYFMEINARLQVEHPVTEYVTGLDLIEQQIAIANGHALSLSQEDIQLRGHAIECRVYAEDPETFMPCPGTISGLCFPDTAGGLVRIEHALRQGSVIPPYYDPMLAKVITWGEDRSSAIRSMIVALQNFKIEGVKTTIDANLSILQREEFAAGDFNTSFLAKE